MRSGNIQDKRKDFHIEEIWGSSKKGKEERTTTFSEI